MDTVVEKQSTEGISPTPINRCWGILSPLNKLKAPWVFNAFNVVVLLAILFLLILQPHRKKDNAAPVSLYGVSINEDLSSSIAKLEDKGQDSKPKTQDSAPTTQVPVEIRYEDRVKMANELFERKEYSQALNEYIKAAEQSSPSTDKDLIQYRLGECYQKSGRFDEALNAYRNIVTGYFQSPYQVRAILREGECLIDKGDFLKARKLLFTLVAQEAQYSDEDKGFASEAYYKIAESYMKEALRYARVQGYSFANEK